MAVKVRGALAQDAPHERAGEPCALVSPTQVLRGAEEQTPLYHYARCPVGARQVTGRTLARRMRIWSRVA